MRTKPTIEITCDECMDNTEGMNAQARKLIDAELMRLGWQVRGGRDICPRCVPSATLIAEVVA